MDPFLTITVVSVLLGALIAAAFFRSYLSNRRSEVQSIAKAEPQSDPKKHPRPPQSKKSHSKAHSHSAADKLPVGANSAELEERIIQHLAAAAAMGRAHHIGRREGQRIRSSTFLPTNRQGISFNNRSPANHSSPTNQDMAGPSDFQSFSESMKSRLNAISLMSMKYKESLSKSTREWKERLFSRNTSVMEQSIQNIAETRGENPLNDSKQPISCAASSTSS